MIKLFIIGLFFTGMVIPGFCQTGIDRCPDRLPRDLVGHEQVVAELFLPHGYQLVDLSAGRRRSAPDRNGYHVFSNHTGCAGQSGEQLAVGIRAFGNGEPIFWS